MVWFPTCGVGEGFVSGCVIGGEDTVCVECGANAVSVGGTSACTECSEDSRPNDSQSACVPCTRQNHFSVAGRCELCEGNVSPDRKLCFECPSHQVPIPYVGGCQCEPGRYNALAGKITCHRRDFEADAWDESPEYQVAKELLASAEKNRDQLSGQVVNT